MIGATSGLLDALAPAEQYWAFPGPEAHRRIRDLFASASYGRFASLVSRVTCDMIGKRRTPRIPMVQGSCRRTTTAGGRSNPRVNQTLKHAAGMAAAAGVYKGLQLAWKQVTGKEPPLGPEDQHAPLGRAVAWTLVMGAAITTARMIVIRYTSRLLPGSQQQAMTETAAEALADNPAGPLGG